MQIFCLTIFLIFAASRLKAADVVFTEKSDSIRLVEQIYHFDNRISRRPAADILFGKVDELFVQNQKFLAILAFDRFGQRGDFWIRITVDNQTKENILLKSSHDTSPALESLIYLPSNPQLERQIIEFPQNLRRSERFFAIPPGQGKIFLELKPDDFSATVVEFFIQSLQHQALHNSEVVVIAISYGIAIALGLYNLILALTLRTRTHFIYLCYNTAIILYYEGRYQIFAQQFGVGELPKWSLLPINAASAILFLAFIADILDIKTKLPKWKMPIQAILYSYPLLAAFSFYDRTHAQLILIFYLIFSTPLVLMLTIHAIIRKVPTARLLIVSALIPGLGSFIHFSQSIFQNYLPRDFIACAQMLAIDIELILLSMTIGYKMNQEREWFSRKIKHGYSELKTIVYPHQLDMIWEGTSLPKTMPTGEAKAYVIVFDIIASSKMTLENPRHFLAKIFYECNELMNENYAKEPLMANAYRIKELGDGFICSVGFPFACPTDRPADLAVDLAMSFLEIFKTFTQKYQETKNLKCAVGIAYGTIEAFYPESGTQVYDMFGRGMILAHRYEAMRNVLLKTIVEEDSIIILHEPVYSALTKNQNIFNCFNLKEHTLTVRDDEQAMNLYYLLASEQEPSSSKVELDLTA